MIGVGSIVIQFQPRTRLRPTKWLKETLLRKDFDLPAVSIIANLIVSSSDDSLAGWPGLIYHVIIEEMKHCWPSTTRRPLAIFTYLIPGDCHIDHRIGAVGLVGIPS